MLFNSFTFIIFFLVVLLVMRLNFSWRAHKLFLLLASYLFYSAWNPPFVVLLWISTVADFYLARWIGQAPTPGRKRFLISFSIIINLGLLCYFKYGGFILDNFVQVTQWLGVPFHPAKLDIILPAGISFYTFLTLSYTLDVYWGRIKAWNSLLDYGVYVTFFPHLIAGPIIRADYFLPQCATPRKANTQQLGWGLMLFIVGLFNKVVIADDLMSGIVEQIYDGRQALGFFEAWSGTLAFTVQIFCDFSGYSTCAIGVAMMLGFALPDNFRFPYAALGFSDFWRRWHISLSSWMRDYHYIPLGGNRKGEGRAYVNLMLTMLLGGLWHGASWMFVLWGGLHGFYLAMEKWIRRQPWSEWPGWRHPCARVALVLVTFFFVCITWVFFRAKSTGRAAVLLGAMLNLTAVSGKFFRQFMFVGVVTAMVLLLHFRLRDTSFEQGWRRLPAWSQSLLLAFMLFGIALTMTGEDRAFIYFQF